MIETKDGRYIKVLEITPINFRFFSSMAKDSVIATFAGLLKIAPVNIQIKTITRRADTEEYIQKLQEELLNDDPACREFAQKYIELLRDIGRNEALNRRYFLIFEYERNQLRADENQIFAVMQKIEGNIRSILEQCQNRVVFHNDENFFLGEFLFSYFNWNLEETFSERIARVTRDFMLEKYLIPGIDQEPAVPLTHIVAPKGIEFHRNYTVMSGHYYTYLLLSGEGYPVNVAPGWLSNIIEMGDGIDIDFFIQQQPRSVMIDKVARSVRFNRTKARETSDTSAAYEDVHGAIDSGMYIKATMSTNNEDFYYLTTLITVSDATYDGLLWKKQQVMDYLKSMDYSVIECLNRQQQAFLSSLPLNKLDKSLYMLGRRNALTYGVASAYPFTGFEQFDPHGIVLGVNKLNNSLMSFDFFDREKYQNGNMLVWGSSGAGKTAFLQSLALRMRMRGIPSYSILTIKGHEFRRAADKIGGSFYRLGAGSKVCLNLMDVKKTISPAIEYLDGADYYDVSILAQQIQFLHTIIGMMVPDISILEQQLVEDAIIKLYAKYGITFDNASIMEGQPLPIFQELYEELLAAPKTERVAIVLKRFAIGSASIFNGQTNVEEGLYNVYDLSGLEGDVQIIALLVVLNRVQNLIRADRTKRKLVLLDEVWTLIGPTSSEKTTQEVFELIKLIRGYGGILALGTQEIEDTFSYREGQYGKALINGSKIKVMMGMEPEECAITGKIVGLTDAEMRSILGFRRGEALISVDEIRIPVSIRLSDAELEVITTDREQLQKIVKQN